MIVLGVVVTAQGASRAFLAADSGIATQRNALGVRQPMILLRPPVMLASSADSVLLQSWEQLRLAKEWTQKLFEEVVARHQGDLLVGTVYPRRGHAKLEYLLPTGSVSVRSIALGVPEEQRTWLERLLQCIVDLYPQAFSMVNWERLLTELLRTLGGVAPYWVCDGTGIAYYHNGSRVKWEKA
jgi:hypothetical protein